jgi:hypothetical protein
VSMNAGTRFRPSRPARRMSSVRPVERFPAEGSTRFLLAARRVSTEMLVVGVLFLLYKLGRGFVVGQERTAEANAQMVRGLEQALHLPSEATVQALVGSTPLYELANTYYVAAHFPLTLAFLAWGLAARPRAEYAWARNLLIVQTFTALAIHVGFPLSPPRMFPEWGFLDTAAVIGPSAYRGGMAEIANQYAAMPSLHVGWAALIAFVVIRTGPRWLAALCVIHATATLAVVIVTANHWWVDGLVSVGLLAVALVVVPDPRRPHTKPSSRPGAPISGSAVWRSVAGPFRRRRGRARTSAPVP